MGRLIFILLFSATFQLVSSQQPDDGNSPERNCSQRLQRAEYFFQNGFYNDCIRLTEESLKTCSFSRSEKAKAYSLLAKSYLETDEQEKADIATNLMLRNSPHYELNDAANFESYNRLVRKYEVYPRFSIGVRNVANWLSRKTTKVYSVLDGLDYSRPISTGDYWFMYYGIAEYQVGRSLSINAELGFFWSSYGTNIFKEPGFNLNFWEKDLFVETFLYAKKYFPVGKNILPYVSAGIGSMLLYDAIGDAEISYTKDDVITGKNTDFNSTMNNIDLMTMRNRTMWSWNAGTGIGYKMKNLRLFLDMRYLGGLRSITNPEKRLSNEILLNDFFYVDNSIVISQFEMGASIYYTLFNSVKRIRR